MRSDRTVRFQGLAVMLGLGTFVPIAGAQTEGPPTPGVGQSGAELALILLSLVVLVLLAGTKAIDVTRRRADQALHLQAKISDALIGERRLTRLPVTATVRPPLWGRSPMRIELRGQVPTAELWRLARQVAEQEASRSLAAFSIDDRVAVVLSKRAHAA
jgi:hypothetical protein